MNIYVITPWYPQEEGDLYGIFVREQAHALAERGHRVTVFRVDPLSVTHAFQKPWHGERVWQDGDVRTIFHEVIIPVPAKLDKIQDAYISNVFYKILKKQIERDEAAGFGKPDVLHTHVSHSCAYYCLEAAKKLSIPLVVTEHYSGLLLGTASDREYCRVRKTIEQSEAFIYVGKRFQHTLNQRLGIDKQTYVVPNLFDPDVFSLKDRAGTEKFTFLTACHLTANKSVDNVILALHKVFPDVQDVRLVIAGDGAEMDHLKALVTELGEKDRVEFFGSYSREQAGELFANADAFVLTSKVETFGIVYLEALASGVPCIGTAGQGADDIIDDTNGFRVTYDDVDELAARMRDLYENRGSYHPQALREDCVARFGKEVICKEIEKVYDVVISK